MQLVSSKYLTGFSDFRISKKDQDFLSPERYLMYLEDFASEFELWSHINCSTRVVKVERDGRGGHNIAFETDFQSLQRRSVWNCHAIVICTGVNDRPVIPPIPGLTQNSHPPYPIIINKHPSRNHNETGTRRSITTLHSSHFKSRAQFSQEEKVVVILGVGETAMDIGHLAVTSPTKSVIMCHRDGFLHAPKITPQPIVAGGRRGPKPSDGPNKPLDCTIASLFDTAYVPSVIQRGPMLWNVYDAFIKNMAYAISGTRHGFDQWVGGIGEKRYHADAVLVVKSDRAMPYINEQYRSKSLWNRARTWLINVPLLPTGGRKIDLAPWPTHVDNDGVMHFERNSRPESAKMADKKIRPDMVVFATGYTPSLPFLSGDYPSISEANFRGIYRDIEDGIAYIGFTRPAFGAIPPIAELQAQLWIYNLLASKLVATHCPKINAPQRSPFAIPQYELDYQMHSRDTVHDFARHKRAVDQESYVYQLMLDLGSAPTWLHVWQEFGREVFFTWAMGPNFTPKSRLIGPWSTPRIAHEAASLMRADGELGTLVRRTGGLVFLFTYTIIPLMIFAPLCVFINASLTLWSGFRTIFVI